MSGFRLSPQQKHLFRLGPEFVSGAGRNLCLARFAGSLDIELLEKALTWLVERYEILRTVYPPVAGLEIPLQSPLDSTGVELLRHHVSCAEDRTPEEKINEIIEAALRKPFDLGKLPLQRMDVIELAANDYYLAWTQPALCGDSASMANLMRELNVRLTRLTVPSTKDQDPLQYADIAEWLNEILEDEDAAQGQRYWRRQLPETPMIALPLVDCGPGKLFHPSRVSVPLDASTVIALQDLANRWGVSLANILAASWVILLARYADNDGVVIGLAADGRSHKDLYQAVGLFAKHVPIHITCSKEATINTLSAGLAAAHNDALDWQEYFSWDLLERGKPAGQAQHLLYLYEHTDLPANDVTGLTVERLESQCDRYAIKLWTSHGGKGHKADLWFDANRFDRALIVRLAESLGALLGDVAARPEAEIGSLNLTSPQESRRVLYDLNPKSADVPAFNSVLELIAGQVAARHDATAVICGSEQMTYGGLWDRAAAIARHLCARNIGCESLVAVCSERSVDMVAAILGVLRAGAAYLPIDPGYPADRQDFMINDAHVAVVLTHSRLAARFNGRQDIIHLDRLGVGDGAAAPDNVPRRDQLAYVIYTSGSTGRPKGVAVTHGNLLASTLARNSFYNDSPECFLLLSSYAFDSSLAGLFWALTTGGTLLLPKEGDEQDIAVLSKMIEQARVTHTLCLPTLYALLLDQLDAERLSSIRTMIVAGETCPASLVKAHFETRPRSSLVNEYGPTEATVWATAARLGTWHTEGQIPIGRPIGNTCVYILDNAMLPVPEGVAGEVYIGGPGVARGYLGRPRQTAERFVPDPFSGQTGARLYRTGDRARYAVNDTLEFLGRMDHQVKIRGYRVEPEEVESQLAAHPSIRQAAVVALADHTGGLRLVAYYSTRGNSTPALSDLLHFLRQQLPDFMIPSAFVAMDTLPLMPNGKIDREALPEPDQGRGNVGTEYAEPSGPVEAYLAERWRDILHTDAVGVHDIFFELGGNSIQAAIFMNRLRGDLGEFIHVGKLFENPTIRQLAGHLTQNHELASRHLAAGNQPPSPAPIQSPDEQRVLEQLDDLSDEQVDVLLEELTAGNLRDLDKGTRQ